MRTLHLLLAMMTTIAMPLSLSARELRVAIYADEGAMEPYIAATGEVAASAGMEVTRVTAADLASGALSHQDVIVFPGGTGNGQARSLGEEGAAAVRGFAEAGGGVIGICAGGYLLVEGYNEDTRRIELIAARLWDLSNWARGTGMVDVRAGEGAEPLRMHFENGAVFERTEGLAALPPYAPLAEFASDVVPEPEGRESMAGKDAIIAAPFGEGRVVLFGPHPELTPGLEDLLVNALRWAAGEGEAEPSLGGVLGLGGPS